MSVGKALGNKAGCYLICTTEKPKVRVSLGRHATIRTLGNFRLFQNPL